MSGVGECFLSQCGWTPKSSARLYNGVGVNEDNIYLSVTYIHTQLKEKN